MEWKVGQSGKSALVETGAVWTVVHFARRVLGLAVKRGKRQWCSTLVANVVVFLRRVGVLARKVIGVSSVASFQVAVKKSNRDCSAQDPPQGMCENAKQVLKMATTSMECSSLSIQQQESQDSSFAEQTLGSFVKTDNTRALIVNV